MYAALLCAMCAIIVIFVQTIANHSSSHGTTYAHNTQYLLNHSIHVERKSAHIRKLIYVMTRRMLCHGVFFV